MSRPLAAPVEIDSNSSRVPSGFKGDDIQQAFRAARSDAKSEFETTQAYRARIANTASKTVYSFWVDPWEVAYDADKEQLFVRVWVKVDPSTTDIEEDSIMIPVHNAVEKSTFPAANALGVQVQVVRTTETAHGLAAVPVAPEVIGQRVHAVLRERYERYLQLPLAMSADEARRRKGSIKLLFRARPSTRTAARTLEGEYEWKATITSPTSRLTKSFGIYVDVFSFETWVVDSATTEVLAKTTVAKLLRLPAPR